MIGHNLLIFFTIRRAIRSIFAILAFHYIAICKVIASASLLTVIDRTAEDAIEEELVHAGTSLIMT